MTDDTARPVPNASGTDRDAIPKAITAARDKALATGKTLKEQINTYWSCGPVPPATLRPGPRFRREVIKPQNRCIALILDGAGVVFDWDDPPTAAVGGIQPFRRVTLAGDPAAQTEGCPWSMTATPIAALLRPREDFPGTDDQYADLLRRFEKLPASVEIHRDNPTPDQQDENLDRFLAWEAAQPKNDNRNYSDKRKRAYALEALAGRADDLARLGEGSRDDDIRDGIYYLGTFVNDGHLSRDEIHQPVLNCASANGHDRDNKSVEQIIRDINRGLDKAADDAVLPDWDKIFSRREEGKKFEREREREKTGGKSKSETDDPATEFKRPRVFKATDLKPSVQTRWIAKRFVPRAAPTVLCGDEGIGKTLWDIRLVAAVSTGTPLPDIGVPKRDPQRVLLAAITEVDWASIVRPRLEVAGADLDMIDVICTETDGSGPPIFPRDFDIIRELDPRPALMVVDSWLDTLAMDTVVRDPQSAARALAPWTDLATTTDAGIILLTPTNRLATGDIREKYGATAHLRKKARMTLFSMRDEDTDLVGAGAG